MNRVLIWFSGRVSNIVVPVVLLAAITLHSLLPVKSSFAQDATPSTLDAPVLNAEASAAVIELAWDAIGGAVRYDLWAWTVDDGWFQLDDGNLTETSFRHGDVATGTEYYYAVRAVDADGTEGSWSEYASATVTRTSALTATSTPSSTATTTANTSTPSPTPSDSSLTTPTATPAALRQPVLTIVSTSASAIALSWTPVDGAGRYDLRAWSSEGGWESLGGKSLTGTTFRHVGVAEGSTYYYWVSGVAGESESRNWSVRKQATAAQTQGETATVTSTSSSGFENGLTMTPSATPTAVRLSVPQLAATPGNGQVILSWGAVAGAVRYELWTWWNGTVGWMRLDEGNLTGTSFTHSGLADVESYHYTVRAWGGGGEFSAWSEYVNADLSEGTPTARATPTDTATPSNTGTPTITPTRATTERGALIALYQATNGDHWERKDNWLTDAPISTWFGVFTNGRGQVIRLHLDDNGLTGYIPDLSSLTQLEELNLRVNSLTGPIPDLSAQTRLQSVYLSYNSLTGPIPDLSALTSLSNLYMAGNMLTGSIPSLDRNYNLEEVGLEGNDLTGEIPRLDSLTKLTHLDLSSNKLTGPIPNLGSLRSLQRLILARNELTGSIPSLNGLTELGALDLAENKLTWRIPDLSAVTKLTFLRLHRNQLTGSIPDFHGFTELTELDLSENDLSGPIPDLGSTATLKRLELNDNMLSGNIPDLSLLTGLTTVDLGSNQLSGRIPDLSLLTRIDWLLLGNNQLEGPVPQPEILKQLIRLDLTGNPLCLPPGADLSQLHREVADHIRALKLSACGDSELSTVPGRPQSFSAAVSGGRVNLSWTAAPNAESYELIVWNSLDRQWGSLGGDLTGTTYIHPVLTDGRNYYFRVRAKNAEDVRGPWSELLYAEVVKPQFPPPPVSLELDLFYQKYLSVGDVVVVAPTEVADWKMVRAQQIVSGMLAGELTVVESLPFGYLRIAIFKRDKDGREAIQLPDFNTVDGDLGGTAIYYKGGLLVIVPQQDSRCYVFIHELAHAIQFALEDLPGGKEFASKLQNAYQYALNAGLWEGEYASTNVFEYWAETVTFWFQGSLYGSPAATHSNLADYDPQAAALIEEVFGQGASVPSYCKP